MRSIFSTYFQLGFQHIADLAGYDHILFLVALCAIYTLQSWKKVIILVTAFTIGHSLTLALAALDIFRLPQDWVEFLIPLTILITALFNVLSSSHHKLSVGFHYSLALFFGLIHGLGFSNFFRAILMPDEQHQLVQQLLAFNLGVEVGQLLIVAVILIVASLAMLRLRVQQREWNLFLSGAAFGLSLIMMLERLP